MILKIPAPYSGQIDRSSGMGGIFCNRRGFSHRDHLRWSRESTRSPLSFWDLLFEYTAPEFNGELKLLGGISAGCRLVAAATRVGETVAISHWE